MLRIAEGLLNAKDLVLNAKDSALKGCLRK